jgi:hypothetical protein
MRDYSKVGPQFWIGKTGKALRKQGIEAQMVAMYLMTSPHANMLGLYYIPQTFIAHETGLGLEGAMKGLQGCIDAGFCRYDEDSEVVWVIEMARFQVGDQLKDKDLRIKGVQNEYDSLPDNPYLAVFFDMYAAAFCMTSKRGETSPLEAPSKPLGSQEQEQEQEQKQEQAQEQALVERRSASPDRDVVAEVFAYWQKTMDSPRSQLDDKRRKAIKGALKLYEPRQVCEAILGCSRSSWHMGENDRRHKFNGLDLILRDADHIDKFIELASKRTTGAESIDERNARIMAELMTEDATIDPAVIDVDMQEVRHAH